MKYLFPFFSFSFYSILLSEEIVLIIFDLFPDYEFSSFEWQWVSNDRNNDLVSTFNCCSVQTLQYLTLTDIIPFLILSMVNTIKDSFLISIDSIYTEPGEVKYMQ